MRKEIKSLILEKTGADRITSVEIVQELWSGFGKLQRIFLDGAAVDSVVVKNIELKGARQHPRGWDTANSYNRKLKSYRVEQEWYASYSDRCNDKCRVPKLLGHLSSEDRQIILLEDLDGAGFDLRINQPNIEELKQCLRWLSNFHAQFMMQPAEGLWSQGTYWHLNTRPDEYRAMPDSKLKRQALKIDEALNSSTYITFIHGDAKIANFCFSDTGSVAAVDFQYVGAGCGIKDVAYLIGSCLSEHDCFRLENELLSFYFQALKEALDAKHSIVEFWELEKEWRKLYPYAWADFSRFLIGWSPKHHKLNQYSKKMIDDVLIDLSISDER